MFTGLVADLGVIEAVERDAAGARLRVSTRLAAEITPGDSVAVCGVCLTATVVDGGSLEVEAMNQTLAVTSLGLLSAGDRVNLELALRAGDRLGGHIVQGHVDGTGEVVAVGDDGFSRRLRLRLEPALLRYAVERGSVTLDGVSLTIAAIGEDWLEVALIPETIERTTLGEAVQGRRLNVECDIVGKYVERLVSPFTDSEDG
jgi:riboflavin synthase